VTRDDRGSYVVPVRISDERRAVPLGTFSAADGVPFAGLVVDGSVLDLRPILGTG